MKHSKVLGFVIAGILSVCRMAMAAPPCPCPADLDGDCDTDVFDFALFAPAFGTNAGDPGYLAAADYDGNGAIDVFDFAFFAPSFGCVSPSYAGEPNPHEPGELEPALPERPGMCGSGPWARSQIDGWVNGVYAFSGEAHQTGVDMVVRGRVMDFEWARKYRSQVGPDTAQGNGWDYSYNIFLEADGADLVLHNGWARCDVYALQLSGNWIAPDFFRELEQLPDTSYLLHFPDTGHWAFHPLDGSPTAGKIDRIEDRNGNTISFGYNGSGQLVTVTDDLGRTYTITYNPDGLIESVNDFTGRQVVYEYYANGDAGGSAGDLKSVRSLVVTGTPNGNDFPLGKTTVYTYTTGFSDELLNHNLLTITDPKGQTYLQYEYAPTTDRSDLLYDRVVRQTWGEPGDLIDLHYQNITPGAGNNDSTLLTVLNLRRGNVKEVYSDESNRIRMCREYTGFADPDLPTTDIANRPTGQLRPGDPAFYEIQWDYSPDGKPTSILHPNLNETQLTYDDPNPVRTAQGNLLQRLLLPGPLGGDQAQRMETFEYEAGFGGCCGTNFVSRHVDFRGNETLHTHDATGNRLTTTERIPSVVYTYTYNVHGQLTSVTHPDNGSGYHRVDQYAYYIVAPQTGYLGAITVDVNGVADTTAFLYNDRGVMTRRVDPRGNDTLYTRNQLDQTVRVESAAVTTSSGPVRYKRDIFYDANDNVVQLDIDNINGDGTTNANAVLTTSYQHDILNHRIRTTREVDPGYDVVTEQDYDANANPSLARLGEATNGNLVANTITLLYDERDLLFQRIRGAGSAEQSTEQRDYDGNRHLVRKKTGLEDATPREHVWAKDGYGRTTSYLDPMGNRVIRAYDANSNRVHSLLQGEILDIAGTAGNVRLQEVTTTFDFMDRPTQIDEQHFVTDTQAAIGDGVATTQIGWSDTSQVLTVTNDNGHVSSTAFDTVNRPSTVTDPSGNSVHYLYNGNGSVISTTSTELADLGNPPQQFTVTNSRDALERTVSVTDGVGNTTSLMWDSRGNLVTTVDALGNVVDNAYDGLSRLVSTARVQTDTGDGAGTVIGSVTTLQEWDDNSRLVSRTDDNGNTTTWVRDALSRVVQMAFADGTLEVRVLDPHGDVVQLTDQNGTVFVREHDRLGRRTRNEVAVLGPGVSSDLLLEEQSWDGRSRLVRGSDEDSLVERRYDSLSNILEESQNGHAIVCTHDGVGNQLSCTYPGGRMITRQFDANERVSQIVDAGLAVAVADYSYIGPGRIESRVNGNGTQAEYFYDGIDGVPNAPGDFGFRRIAGTRHTNTSTLSTIDDRVYAWNPLQSKSSRVDIDPLGPQYTHAYAYDSIQRLVNTVVTDSNALVVRDETYGLDGVHNRVSVTGGVFPGAYANDPGLPTPADAQMNQYTTTSLDSREYDENGNLTLRDPAGSLEWHLSFDVHNQLVEVQRLPSGDTTHFGYDVLGRRTSKTVQPGSQSTLFFYDGWQVVEERDGVGTTQATYVYGIGIDEVIQMSRGGSEYFYHQDDMGNVMALSDETGSVVERYEYGDYGLTLNAATLARVLGNPSAVGNPYLFQGRRYDSEFGMYYFRTRYLDPRVGRFITRDTLGTWGDSLAHGSATAAFASSPFTRRDPFGRGPTDQCEYTQRVPEADIAAAEAAGVPVPQYDVNTWYYCCPDGPDSDSYPDCVLSSSGDAARDLAADFAEGYAEAVWTIGMGVAGGAVGGVIGASSLNPVAAGAVAGGLGAHLGVIGNNIGKTIGSVIGDWIRGDADDIEWNPVGPDDIVVEGDGDEGEGGDKGGQDEGEDCDDSGETETTDDDCQDDSEGDGGVWCPPPCEIDWRQRHWNAR